MINVTSRIIDIWKSLHHKVWAILLAIYFEWSYYKNENNNFKNMRGLW